MRAWRTAVIVVGGGVHADRVQRCPALRPASCAGEQAGAQVADGDGEGVGGAEDAACSAATQAAYSQVPVQAAVRTSLHGAHQLVMEVLRLTQLETPVGGLPHCVGKFALQLMPHTVSLQMRVPWPCESAGQVVVQLPQKLGSVLLLMHSGPALVKQGKSSGVRHVILHCPAQRSKIARTPLTLPSTCTQHRSAEPRLTVSATGGLDVWYTGACKGASTAVGRVVVQIHAHAAAA